MLNYAKMVLLLAVAGWSENILLSNYCYGVAQGPIAGSLWVIARGESNNTSGYSVMQFSNSLEGVQVLGATHYTLPETWVGVHDKFYLSSQAENRRSIFFHSGSMMIGQVFAEDSADEFTAPNGVFRINGNDEDPFLIEAGGFGQDQVASYKSPLDVSIHSVGFDHKGILWLARGAWGVARTNGDASKWKDNLAVPDSVPVLMLNYKKSRWDTLKTTEGLDSTKHLPVYAILVDSLSGKVWLGSERGLWQGHRDSSALRLIRLGSIDTLRITGIWADSANARIVVESEKVVKQKPVSSLWTSWNGGSSFVKVAMPYDSLDISVSSVAFLGDTAWLAAQGMENNSNGLIKLRGAEAFRWADSLVDPKREESSRYLWGLEAKVIDRDVFINGVTTFSLGQAKILAVSTDGAGIALSADQGHSWRQILNQKAVKGGLKEIRMIPSVMRGYGTSLVGYSLNNNVKVTIEVFSYDMRKVRTIVKNASRLADPVRSSNPREDVWDGRDDAGNVVVAGMYYVRVRDNKDHESWGKVMFLGGAQ